MQSQMYNHKALPMSDNTDINKSNLAYSTENRVSIQEEMEMLHPVKSRLSLLSEYKQPVALCYVVKYIFQFICICASRPDHSFQQQCPHFSLPSALVRSFPSSLNMAQNTEYKTAPWEMFDLGNELNDLLLVCCVLVQSMF